MAKKLEGADRPWFIWVRSGRHCGLRPYSRAGWLLTLLYTAAAIGLSLFLLARDEPGAARLIVWGVLMTALTLAFLVSAWRMSATVIRDGDRCGRQPTASDPARAVVIAVLTASVIIGAALFGARL